MKQYTKILLLMLLGLAGCNTDHHSDHKEKIESTNQIIRNNGFEIRNYQQLKKAFKNGKNFMIQFHLGQEYTKKQFQKDHHGLDGAYHSLYVHHFSDGVMDKDGDIEFSGSTNWDIAGTYYLHTYHYIFKPSNKVLIKGSDIMTASAHRKTLANAQQHAYQFKETLNKGVKVYVYK